MTRLAAAHRAAVRALQMFVNHAPLYYTTNKSLPPMYTELGGLIRQLAMISDEMGLENGIPGYEMTAFDDLKVRAIFIFEMKKTGACFVIGI